MVFHSAVERIPIIPALDPLWLLIFTLVFAGAAAVTMRRPVYGAALLALVTPFALPHAIFATTVTLGKAALIGVLAGWFARGESAPLARLPRAVMIAFGAIVVVDLLSGVHAEHRADVIGESLKWVEYAAYFAAVFLCYQSDPQPAPLRAALAISFIAVAASALAELATGAGSVFIVAGHVVPRIAGALEGPNQLGGYLEIIIAVLAAITVRERTRVGALLLGLAGVTVALCFSRAALISSAAALIAIASVERERIVYAWSVLAGAAAGYAVMLLGTPGLPASALFAAAFGVRASDFDPAISGGVGSRSELWRAAIVLFRSHPLIGVGAGNYQFELPKAGLYGVRTQANEWYLQSLAEGGVLLLIAIIAWLAALVRTLVPLLRRSAWSLGAFAATCAVIVHGFGDDLVFYPKVAETWMVVLALGCATGRDSTT